MRNILLSMIVSTFALAGCGGGGDKNDAFQPPGTPPPGGGGGNGPAAATLTIVTSAPSIPSDGSATATITAYARNAQNVLVEGVPVTFQASSGGVSSSSGTTGTDGSATATLSTAGDSSVRTITVTATSGSLNATVNVQVAAGGTTTSVAMGSPAGTGFQAGVLGITNASLSAGGSTSLQAVLQQSDGSLYTQSATVSFSSPCAAQGLATIPSPVTTTTGIANATYSATGCSGSDVITATATIGGTPVSANGTVTVAAGTPPYLAVLLLAFFSNLCATLTHYGTTPGPIYFGADYVPQTAWWRLGLLASFVNIPIWVGVGLIWWKVLGLF